MIICNILKTRRFKERIMILIFQLLLYLAYIKAKILRNRILSSLLNQIYL